MAAIAAVMMVPSASVAAQARALTDRDFQVAETFLRLEARRMGLADAIRTGSDRLAIDYQAVGQSVIDGEADALAVARGWQPELAPPPGGTYDAACSRVATRESNRALTVVFTFGIAADETGRRILAGDSTALRHALEQDLSARERTPAGARIRTLMERLQGFYLQRGYAAPPRQGAIVYRWTLERPGISVVMEPINGYHLNGCEHLPDGPVLTMLVSTDVPQELVAAEAQVLDGADRWQQMLDRYGMTQQQWYDLRQAVMLAHDDAHAAQPIERGIEPDLLPFLAESIALRKKNAASYRQHAARLDPLVDVTKVSP